MNKLRKILIAAGLLMLLWLAGCNGTISEIDIDTKLTVSTSFNGERLMTAQIPAAAFRRMFNNDVDTLKNVIDRYIPGSMYCTAQTMENGDAQILMRIDFASVSEYQEKISKICSGNTAEDAVVPVINFDYSHSILKNGYTIEENFTSMDLFYWLSDAIRTEFPAFKSQDLTNVFQLGTTQVVFDGENIDLNGNDMIQVSNIESNPFDSITVMTEIDEDNVISAEIRYSVSSALVESLGTRLENMMNNLVPKDGKLDFADKSNRRIYTMTFSRETEDEYRTAVNKALGSNNTVFAITTEGDSESLAAKKSVVQFYDGSYFLDFTNPDTTITYILRMPSNYSLESCSSKYGYLTNERSNYSTNYCEINMTLQSSDEVTAIMGFAVDIDAVDVQTVMNAPNSIDRKISFKLSSEADTLIGSSIKDRLTEAAEGWSDPENMKVETDSLINSTLITIVMHAASPEELTQMMQTILGGEESVSSNGEAVSSFSAVQEKPENPWKRKMSSADTLNFSAFLKGSSISNGISYKLTFPRHYMASFTENDAYEDAATDGESITCTTNNKIMAVRAGAETWNIEGIVVFVCWALMIVILFVIAVFNIDHIVHYLNTKTLDMDGEVLFKGRPLMTLTVSALAFVCFVIMTIRLIFKIY